MLRWAWALTGSYNAANGRSNWLQLRHIRHSISSSATTFGSPHLKREWKPAFIEALRTTGNVTRAAQYAGRSRNQVHDVRQRSKRFAAQWDNALEEATDLLEAEARRRAFTGIDKPVFYKGKVVGSTKKCCEAANAPSNAGVSSHVGCGARVPSWCGGPFQAALGTLARSPKTDPDLPVIRRPWRGPPTAPHAIAVLRPGLVLHEPAAPRRRLPLASGGSGPR